MTREEAINYLKSSGVRIRMTRTEAINYLKSSGMSDKQIETVINAFTCDDCISRTDAMDMILCYGNEIKAEVMDDIKASMIKLPSVTPKASEDYISREAVIDIIDFEDKWLHDANGHNANTKIAFSGLRSKVKALTSVTPEESEDCISRKEAIKEFQVYREYSSNMTNIDWVDRIENVLTYLPSVTPKAGSEAK